MGYRPEVGAGVADVDCSDATVLVTGSTDGLGRETALALGRLGATVILHGRDRAKGERVRAAVAATDAADVDFFPADFSSLAAVSELAAAVADRCDRLDVLVNNAGAWFPTGRLTDGGVEATFAVNHLAPFLLTHRLRPHLASDGRVVTVTSSLHRRADAAFDADALTSLDGYEGRAAYARSKLANVLFTVELAARLAGTGVTATCLNPGPVPTTRLARDVSGVSRAVYRAVGVLYGLRRGYLTDHTARGATTSVYLAAAPDVSDATGAYFEDCAPAAPADAAGDAPLRERLWSVSERLCGLTDGTAAGA